LPQNTRCPANGHLFIFYLIFSTPLLYWVATLHISLLSSKKLWVQKGVFGLDRFDGLTGWVH